MESMSMNMDMMKIAVIDVSSGNVLSDDLNEEPEESPIHDMKMVRSELCDGFMRLFVRAN